jgi:hypothetical protein
MSRHTSCLLVLVLLLAGCFPVLFTDAPLGEPATFSPGEWNGVWICSPTSSSPGKLRRVQVRGPDSAEVSFSLDWRECNAEPADRWFLARRYNNWFFASCEGRLVTGEPCFTTRVALREGETLSLYVPDEKRIRELLAQGKVSGRIEFEPGKEIGRVVLHSLTADHYSVLFDPNAGAFSLLIGSKDEGRCLRLPAEADPCNWSK